MLVTGLSRVDIICHHNEDEAAGAGAQEQQGSPYPNKPRSKLPWTTDLTTFRCFKFRSTSSLASSARNPAELVPSGASMSYPAECRTFSMRSVVSFDSPGAVSTALRIETIGERLAHRIGHNCCDKVHNKWCQLWKSWKMG